MIPDTHVEELSYFSAHQRIFQTATTVMRVFDSIITSISVLSLYLSKKLPNGDSGQCMIHDAQVELSVVLLCPPRNVPNGDRGHCMSDDQRDTREAGKTDQG